MSKVFAAELREGILMIPPGLDLSELPDGAVQVEVRGSGDAADQGIPRSGGRLPRLRSPRNLSPGDAAQFPVTIRRIGTPDTGTQAGGDPA